MKKSVMLMAGFLAMALAGSAQAATCTGCAFAVQDSTGTNDNFTVDPSGLVNAGGQALNLGGSLAGGLSKIPLGAGPALTAGAGAFHFATEGSAFSSGAFLVQHAATESNHATTPGVYSSTAAPNFSFYRINKYFDGTYVLPSANAMLGYINFGTIDPLVSPASSRKNNAIFAVRAEGTWSAITNTPTFFVWSNTTNPVSVGATEKMRLTSDGKLGIGVTTPTSTLSVAGLVEFADNAAAKAALLTDGAFYRTGDIVKVVHTP